MPNTVYFCGDTTSATYSTSLLDSKYVKSKTMMDLSTYSVIISTNRGDVPLLFKVSDLPTTQQLGRRDVVVFVYETSPHKIVQENIYTLSRLDKSCKVLLVEMSPSYSGSYQVGNYFTENITFPHMGENLLVSIVRYVLKSNSASLLSVPRQVRVQEVPDRPTQPSISSNREHAISSLDRLNTIVKELLELQSKYSSITPIYKSKDGYLNTL